MFLACFGEHETASMVAKLLLEEPIEESNATDVFYSEFHKREINMLDFYQFYKMNANRTLLMPRKPRTMI